MTDAPPPAAVAPVNPGKTMGVVSLVLSIIGIHLIGIIVGFVGLNQSKKAGQKNGFALAGIIIGFIGLAIFAVFVATSGALLGSLFGGLGQVCAELGTGEWVVDGVTYTCP